MAWQPIETAPKDGTMILLFQTGKACIGPVLGWWQGGNYPWSFIDSHGPAECPNCEYEIADYIDPNGFDSHFPPTHWQPLPGPPHA